MSLVQQIELISNCIWMLRFNQVQCGYIMSFKISRIPKKYKNTADAAPEYLVGHTWLKSSCFFLDKFSYLEINNSCKKMYNSVKSRCSINIENTKLYYLCKIEGSEYYFMNHYNHLHRGLHYEGLQLTL